MNKIAFVLSILSLMGCVSGLRTNHTFATRDVPFDARNSNGELRKRLFVLPFIDGTGNRSESLATTARQAFLKALGRSDNFVLVELKDFPGELARFKKESEYDLPAIGKNLASLGVVGVVEGKVLDLRARRLSDEVGLMRSMKAQVETHVRLRVWGVRGERELLNEVRQAQVESTNLRFAKPVASDREMTEDPKLIEDVITQAFNGAVIPINSAIQKISWEGRVAMVKGEKVYLNAGRVSGLQIGDILRVMGENEDIFDPETGALIGKAPGRMKGTLEIVSYFGQDGAVAIIHSGAGFRENDHVDLY